MKPLTIAIDASNLGSGGARTHIRELLRAVDPRSYGIERVKIWGGSKLLAGIQPREWLDIEYVSILDKGIVLRTFWQQTQLKKFARNYDLLFVPGAGNGGGFHPYVTMSRNMLPFEREERERYGVFSHQNLKLLIMNYTMARSFAEADGLIFLTQYAKDTILKQVTRQQGFTEVIPHGVDPRFLFPPRKTSPLQSFASDNRLQLLYVSPLAPYKHQETVIQAVHQLHSENFPIRLTLVGDALVNWYAKKILQLIKAVDPGSSYIEYYGYIPYDKIETAYRKADVFIFASTCENLPNTLVEAMACGLPILSSDKGPMREVLQDGGLYFAPTSVKSLVDALHKLLPDANRQYTLASRAYELAQDYSWEKCANMTFAFLAQCARK